MRNMRNENEIVPIHQDGECHNEVNDKSCLSWEHNCHVETSDGRIHIHWDEGTQASRIGQFVYFAEFLQCSNLFEDLVEYCPLTYESNNAPSKRDILGTMLLSVLSGHTRYAHITAIRGEQANAQLLSMRKITSEDSVRAATLKLSEHSGKQWLWQQLKKCYLPLLEHEWILDVDTTVKVLYGNQEGAAVGYNSHKPGRPSHAYHSYWMANIRIFLGLDVHPGNEHHSKYGLDNLVEFITGLDKGLRPSLVRGDCGYGNERWMAQLESIGQAYLFKLRLTKKVKSYIYQLECGNTFEPITDGWEYVQGQLRLEGWSCERKLGVFRRPVKKPQHTHAVARLPCGDDSQLDMFEQADIVIDEQVNYRYMVLVGHQVSVVDKLWGGLYLDRSDNENCYDELKNQLGSVK